MHPIEHVGQHFKVRGPLNVPRSPQGRPVLIQAGGSEDGRNLAALHAEAIFSVAQTEAEGLEFAQDARTRANRIGRTDPIVFLPGLATMIGSTEAEIMQREQDLWDLLPTGYGLARVAGLLQIDPTRLELNQPLPADLTLPETACRPSPPPQSASLGVTD